MELNKIKIKSYTRADGSTYYRKAIRINGKKYEKTFSRKVDADKWYQEKKREKELIERGLSPNQSEITVAEFAAEWHEKRKLNGKPFSSWSSDSGRLKKWILPFFGHREMGKIQTIEWEQFLDGLVAEEDLAPATRNRIRSVATKMYNDGIRLGKFSHNPVAIVPKLKETMETWSYWSNQEDILKYLTAAKNESPVFYVFASLALNLGTRIGETLALDIEDLDLDHRRISIGKIYEELSGDICYRTKAHKKRWLGINDSLIEILRNYKYQTRFNKSTDPILCDESGKRLTGYALRQMHDRVCLTANIKRIRIHDLRHTYASHYIMNGGSLSELQALLGHSTPMMTMKYAHLAPGFLERKANVVSFGLSDDLTKSNVSSTPHLRKIK